MLVSLLLAIGFTIPASTSVLAASASAAPTDAPNAIRLVTRSSPRGTAIWQPLSYNTDLDYFRFAIPHTTTVRVTLDALPGDYSLYLFNAAGAVVGSSARPGRQDEEVYRRLPAGTWYARVMRQSGAVDPARPYELKFLMYGTGFYLISSRTYLDDDGRYQFTGEVLNTTDYEQRVDVAAQLRDQQGRLLETTVSSVWAWPLRAGARSAVWGGLYTPTPVGYNHTTFVVRPQGGYYVIRGIAVVPGPACTPSPDPCQRTYTVTNRNTFPVADVGVWETAYNSRGGVQYTRASQYPPPQPPSQPPPPLLQPGASATLVLSYPHFDGVVRTGFDYWVGLPSS